MSQVVLVTGGTQGIGEAIAHLLATQGWTVVISGRNTEKGAQVVQAIEQNNGKADFIRADIGIESEVKSLHEQVLAKYGRLDAAVNNAGISIEYGKFADLSSSGMEKLFNVNVYGVFWSMQAQIKAMLPHKKGVIVNISSVAGLHGVPTNGVYSATKHAVMGMTKSAALDYAKDGINISAVAPACIKTEIMEQAMASGAFPAEAVLAMHPVGRLGETVDVAKAVSFLLDAPFVTGAIIEVDGGYGAI